MVGEQGGSTRHNLVNVKIFIKFVSYVQCTLINTLNANSRSDLFLISEILHMQINSLRASPLMHRPFITEIHNTATDIIAQTRRTTHDNCAFPLGFLEDLADDCAWVGAAG